MFSFFLRQIIQGLGSNFVLKDKILSIETAIPFSLIEKGLASVNAESARLEPKKRGSTKGKGESFDSPNPAWLRQLDDFRTIDWKITLENLKIFIPNSLSFPS